VARRFLALKADNHPSVSGAHNLRLCCSTFVDEMPMDNLTLKYGCVLRFSLKGLADCAHSVVSLRKGPMRFLHSVATLCVVILLCSAAAAQSAETPDRPLRTLTTAHEAHDISLEEAARGYPVRIRGVVTFYDAAVDPRHAALFVHDSTGSIFIGLPSHPVLALNPGTRVEVNGISGTGDYAPVILHGRVRAIGESHLPKDAPRPTMAELLAGSQDGQWVEIEGIVRSVRLLPLNVILEIATVGGSITATAPREAVMTYDSLIDTKVRIRGNAVPVFNGNRQMVGAHILFPSIHEAKVVQSAPSDPYTLPAIGVDRLLWFSPGVVLRHRVHIRGAVTLHWPGRVLCIQETSHGLCMESPKFDKVQVGQIVDVVGFPSISEFKPTLENASFRVAEGSAPSAVAPVSIQQALRGEHDRELVQIEGELIGQDRAAGDLTLVLRSGEFVFSAVLPKESGGVRILPWKEGSLIRVTGICNVKMDPKTTGQGSGSVQPSSVSILLRSLDDVAVLHSPSWWTAGHALALLSIVGALACASFAWIFALRRRVVQQTQAICLSEERLRYLSQHDVLTGLPNRFLLNDRLSVALKRGGRFDSALGVLMIDLDGFKEVNDSLGHHSGDLVLCEVAARLVCSVRQTDTVARLGGDEFIVLLPDLHHASEAGSVAEKIVAAISEPIEVEGTHVQISASVGVCTSQEQCGDAEQLMHDVDAAMYLAKANGRNRFQVYSKARKTTLVSLNLGRP
jgi:diguanylate cyclase (GGDEF)-like protein